MSQHLVTSVTVEYQGTCAWGSCMLVVVFDWVVQSCTKEKGLKLGVKQSF